MRQNCTKLIGGLILCLALHTSLIASEPEIVRQNHRSYEFGNVRFDNQFPGARLNDCAQISEREFVVTIRPEVRPINNSAWYAFRVSAGEEQTIQVDLRYEAGRHRYPPKVSTDGRTWKALEPERVRQDPAAGLTRLTLDVGPRPLLVAAQEMVGVAELGAWARQLAARPEVRLDVAGNSTEGRPLDCLTLGGPAKRIVFIIGRQHPPEVTGSEGLMAFVEEIAGGSPLARRFRQEFTTVVIPLVNPDGVAEGHWRTGPGGKDLNRDWEDFSQPETRVVREAVESRLRDPEAKLWLWLDFHSTGQDVFYVQDPSLPTFPSGFTPRWLDAIRGRFPAYKVRVSGSLETRGIVSKGWAYRTYGVPAITYELGDETDRELIRKIAGGASEEMMRLLLELAAPVP